jgi:N-acetylneuraminate synthase/sialic acid synthase
MASANFLMRVLDPPCFKIASADIINYELIDYVASLGKPIIISTGAATEGDVDRAMHVAYHHTQQVALLQCTAMYPAPAGSLNLNVITTYRERYPSTVIGYSSHYSGIADALLAYALGARIIEKHFTLDRTMKGSDHVFSLEPDGFKKMVSYLKNARLMLGSETKEVLPEEAGMIDKMRKTTRWWQGLEVKV